MARRMMPSTRSGSPDTRLLGAGGVLWMWAKAMAIGVSPSNGSWPVTISKSTAPRAYRSADRLTAPPRACSGERYCTDPKTVPACVMVTELNARAIPKSVTFTWASGVSRMFCGLMSRCTIPWLWANSNASATCAAICNARSGASRPSRRMYSLRLAPSTYSMAM